MLIFEFFNEIRCTKSQAEQINEDFLLNRTGLNQTDLQCLGSQISPMHFNVIETTLGHWPICRPAKNRRKYLQTGEKVH